MVARLFDRIPLRRRLLDWFGQGEDCVEILGMLSLYHYFLMSFSVEILGMFRY